MLRIVKKKIKLVDRTRARHWKTVGHALRHLEELHNIILEGMIEGRNAAGQHRNCYTGQIKCDAGVTTYKGL